MKKIKISKIGFEDGIIVALIENKKVPIKYISKDLCLEFKEQIKVCKYEIIPVAINHFKNICVSNNINYKNYKFSKQEK